MVPNTIVDLKKLRAQIAEERSELAERERALDKIEEMLRRGRTAGAAGEDAAAAKVNLPKGLSAAVRAAVATFGNQEFGVPDIEALLRSNDVPLPKVDPRGRIAMTVKSLVDADLIKRTYKGAGRTPHRYRLKK